jgi:hypothetical protein
VTIFRKTGNVSNYVVLTRMNENIHMIQNTYNKIGESWKIISLLTIKNCFKHSSFYK